MGLVGGTRELVRAAALPALLVVGLAGSACASDLVATQDGFVNTRRGWRIGAPGGAWTRARVEGAELAFRDPSGAWLSLASRCGVAREEPRVLVRRLATGLPSRTLVREGEVRLEGRPGWSQTWRTRLGDVERELDAVSVVVDGCVYDWVLVSAPGSASLDESFERWWRSFRLGEPEATALGGAP
jgi:hypothetical protein